MARPHNNRGGRPPRQAVVRCKRCDKPFSVNARRAELGAPYCSKKCYHQDRTMYDVYRGAGVYVIKHLPSGRVYVGSTKNCAQRWRTHVSDLSLERHSSDGLLRDWRQDGIAALKMIVLACVHDEPERLKLEAYYIRLFKSDDPAHGYNKFHDGHTAKGYKASDQARGRMSQAQQGTKSIQAKMSEDDVREVRRMRAAGVTRAAISRHFKVNYEIIFGICAGRRYRNVLDIDASINNERANS